MVVANAQAVFGFIVAWRSDNAKLCPAYFISESDIDDIVSSYDLRIEIGRQAYPRG